MLRYIVPLVLLVSSVSAQAGEREMTDRQVQDAITREFVFDSGVPSENIDVRVDDGVALLSGTVGNLLARDRAVLIAETVRGVRSVVDQIGVSPAQFRTDEAIVADVENALLSDPATESYEVIVTASDGDVTLAGTVDSWNEKKLAGMVARGILGVRSVSNHVAIAYHEQRSDIEMEQEIEQVLRWDPLVDDGLIEVTVEEGDVSLSGIVGSSAEKRRARYDAWTSGVRGVNDDALEVARWARDEDLRKQKYVYKSDEEIEKAVQAALVRDPRVFSFDVAVAADAGVVALSGEVDNVKAKRAAGSDAKNTVGVFSVENQIRVQPSETFSDEDVAIQVRDALHRDPYVDRFEIDVAVRDGTAFLSGMVDTYFEKGRADDAASRVRGVTSVVNNLVVDSSPLHAFDPYVDTWDPNGLDWYDLEPIAPLHADSAVEERIEDELWWSPFVDSDDVTVRVAAGVATLTGTVDSWREREAAESNAYEGGAVAVVNELLVDWNQ